MALQLHLTQLKKDLGDLTGEQIIQYFHDYPIKILGKELKCFSDLDPLIELLDVDYQVYCDNTKSYINRFILGRREIKHFGDYEVHFVTNEFIRSPNYTLSEVASLQNEGMRLRQEAIEVVFYQKWYNFYSQSKSERIIAQKHPNSALREGFKQFALRKSNAHNQKDVKKISDEIISTMTDGIIYHEIGHIIADSDISKDELNYQRLYVSDDNLIHGIMELLADWAPERGDKKGSIARFIETSKKDFSRAERNVYMYLSDNFFIDVDDEYFGHLTNVIVSICLSFIGSKGKVEFERMESERKNIYNFLLITLKDVLFKLMSVIKSSDYNIDDKNINFSELETIIYNEYLSNNKISLEEYRDTFSYWKQTHAKLVNHSKTGLKFYNDILKDETAKFELSLLNLITNNRSDEFNNSLRKYIYDKAEKIGIIKISNHDMEFINFIENYHKKIA